MACIPYCHYGFSAFVAFSIFGSNIQAVPSQQLEWNIEIVLFEDSYHQQPVASIRAKQAYYEEMFRSVSRRLSLLRFGHFNIIWKGVHMRWKSFLAPIYSTSTSGKQLVVLVTGRTLKGASGDDVSGFAVKGGICTGSNVAMVKDDGSFSAVNSIVKVFLHAMGVDMDGVGAAARCSANAGHLMGKGLLNVPLSFSECSRSLAQAALSNHKCLKKSISRKTKSAILSPPIITRQAFCLAHKRTPCDSTKMDSLGYRPKNGHHCYVFCCKHHKSEKLVAPDGLECGEDNVGILDKRCINGMCKQML
ncbi:uncharacterized protein LOC142589085 isoform X3 [Dermacentor variabilis]|uniref:uncharacterized protein LOC142589085 isoform X3 n=1 Tax=Dermacentor variabilis TaxID=34621 RepID=UPI003F5BE26D